MSPFPPSWQIAVGALLAALGSLTAADEKIPAFPGAEGYGAGTTGGRGGRIIFVDNLKDSGPGSFRAACEAIGPRIVVFRVGGIIEGQGYILVKYPDITIAGQTAPGDGICLKNSPLVIEASNAIVRYLRVRPGDEPAKLKGSERDGIAIAKDGRMIKDVILDHCSVSWAIDENVSTWYLNENITIQWCMISEGLHHSLHEKGGHSMGLLIGDHTYRISVHHNLMVHNDNRNPQPKGDTFSEIVNNVVFNWGYAAVPIVDPEKSGPAYADIIGNTFIPGVNSRPDAGCIDLHKTLDPATRVYETDNIVEGTLPLFVRYMNKPEYHVKKRIFPDSGLRVEPAIDAYNAVLEGAGATLPVRDAVDTRVLDLVKNRSGKIIDSQKDVGGWPVYGTATPPTDQDNDGMPDEWERRYKLPTDKPGSSNDSDSDGYTDIEEFLNGTSPLVKN